MDAQTIETKFDPKSLPRWAQNDNFVVYGCFVNLAFRCDVFDAKARTTKRFLIEKAHRCWPRAEFELARTWQNYILMK